MNRRRSLFTILALITATSLAKAASETIYDEKADAHQQINAAITEATRAHKNIVLDFGANWCGDCHALDQQMHKPELASLIEKNYVVVKVDVGRFDKNLDVAEKYHVPIKRSITNMIRRTGIPALAVLDPHGGLLFSEGHEFASARQLPYEDFKAFFEKWKPKG